MALPALLLSALRTAAQGVWTYLALLAASHGVTLPDWMQNWFVETIVIAGVLAGVTWLIRWLESRPGESLFARAARMVGKLLMMGLSTKQPVYADRTDEPSIIVGDMDGKARPAVQ